MTLKRGSGTLGGYNHEEFEKTSCRFRKKDFDSRGSGKGLTNAENKTSNSVNESDIYKVKGKEWVRVSQENPSHPNRHPVSDQEPVKKVRSKLNEALVGRYLIGALASLLVFVGAVSLVALFWGSLTPLIKLGMLVSVGVILTAAGLVRIKKYNNPITSIILGTGSGLLFISILAANLAFALISSATAYLLAGIWSVLVHGGLWIHQDFLHHTDCIYWLLHSNGYGNLHGEIIGRLIGRNHFHIGCNRSFAGKCEEMVWQWKATHLYSIVLV